MAFDQSTISNERATRSGADLLVRWDSAAAAGTTFQVYLDRRLAWHGTAKSCVLPYPTDGAGAAVSIDIGAVAAGEAVTDFSASLPALGYANQATLSWYGGTYESATIAGFRIYASPSAGQPVSYTSPVASVAAYPQGMVRDGAGVGPAGYGGAGEAASRYSWTSGKLAAGVWTFGVKPYDSAGNEGAATEVSYTAAAPPNPPAANSAGLRLTVQSYDSTTRVAVLAWLASP